MTAPEAKIRHDWKESKREAIDAQRIPFEYAAATDIDEDGSLLTLPSSWAPPFQGPDSAASAL